VADIEYEKMWVAKSGHIKWSLLIDNLGAKLTDHRNGFCDWPVFLPGDREPVRFDHPEQIPVYVKNWLRAKSTHLSAKVVSAKILKNIEDEKGRSKTSLDSKTKQLLEDMKDLLTKLEPECFPDYLGKHLSVKGGIHMTLIDRLTTALDEDRAEKVKIADPEPESNDLTGKIEEIRRECGLELERVRTAKEGAMRDMAEADLAKRLNTELDWTPDGGEALVKLATEYGAWFLRYAAALAVAMDIEDGSKGY
jgi:hypothetical protein